ncbi:hypothetical protein RSAG8_11039, partial [Rhizoctonia solani AG-8 WAC10335]
MLSYKRQIGHQAMARYRGRYSLITFPSDATYTPPTLPTHMTVNLQPVLGAPSDGEIIKVQDALQSYQEFKRIPSMFDTGVNMELSQHLFDLQMARYMRLAGENPPSPEHPSRAIIMPENPAQMAGHSPNTIEEPVSVANNAGTGEDATEVPRTPQSMSGMVAHELMERSNQLAERFDRFLECFIDVTERSCRLAREHNSQAFAERFNQVLERLTQLIEQHYQPREKSNKFTEDFSQFLERFNQLIDKLHQPAQRANELAERSNDLADRANQLAERSNKPVEKLGEQLKNINRVLVGIQHAIVRNHKGNTTNAVDCLVNEKGQIPGEMRMDLRSTFRHFSEAYPNQPQYPMT